MKHGQTARVTRWFIVLFYCSKLSGDIA